MPVSESCKGKGQYQSPMPCIYFLTGNCRYTAAECRNSHVSIESWRGRGAEANATEVKYDTAGKALCFKFLAGICTNRRCQYSHLPARQEMHVAETKSEVDDGNNIEWADFVGQPVSREGNTVEAKDETGDAANINWDNFDRPRHEGHVVEVHRANVEKMF